VVTQGADAVVTTVHPMGSSREVQHRVGVEDTPVLARAARDAGVARLVHVSTVGVYDLSADVGDVAEDGALLPEGSGDYTVTKNATDASLAQVGGSRPCWSARRPSWAPGHVGLEHAATPGEPPR
jgi:nucleoside-diphosphate-sugar epimerase